jgi:hypothetical protein
VKNFNQFRDQKSVRKYFELKDCVDCEEKITLGKVGAEAYFFHIKTQSLPGISIAEPKRSLY